MCFMEVMKALLTYLPTAVVDVQLREENQMKLPYHISGWLQVALQV